MKQKMFLCLMLLLFFIPPVCGEVVDPEHAQFYSASIFILKTLGQLAVICAAAYCILMDIPLNSIISDDDESSDENSNSRIVRISQYLILLAALVGVIELVGKVVASLMGITIPGV